MRHAGRNILDIDPYLEPFKGDLELRMERFSGKRRELLGEDGNLVEFANGYEYFGFHRTEETGLARCERIRRCTAGEREAGEMMAVYEYLHEKHIEKAGEIKAMLAMF